ncbi:hypothetical protein CGZ94_15300 [Enemella evansiae]|uniref:SGNH hydrolase-type esterase domain-containing protein n=1 Tax=Enemella evansiae TaxID=2016499 RepID=A0A255G8A0_9ACTN|nr:SGNH/GDSL hydrolase family protein [Enemella evansiae]OYO11771.1 hypothetical protein CGZ94_15300 [Enemella evansiae]
MQLKRWPVLGLVVLAVITMVLVVLAFRHARPPSVNAVPMNGPGSPAAPAAGSPVPTVSSAATPRTTPAASATPRQRSLEAIRDLVRSEDQLDIVVLGDASGAGEDKWVAQWADSLAANRRIELRAIENGRASTRNLGNSGSSTVLRNVSESGLTLRDATNRFDQLVPAGTDLVILNFGHQESEGSISADLDRLWNRIPPSATGLVMLQNPERGATQQAQRNRVRAVTDWASRNRAPTVDVFDAFIQAPEPLAELLDRDGVLPNGTGSRVWRDELVKRVG